MKFTIKHEKKGRIRVHLFQKYMNFTQADTLQYYLENLDGVKKAQDRKSTRLNSSHITRSRMPSSA